MTGRRPKLSFQLGLGRAQSKVVRGHLMAQLVKNLPAVWETWVQSWVGKIPWRQERLSTPLFWPGEFHGLYSPLGRKESDMIE